MEVDKVADEVTDMEIPIEDLTEVILEIGDWMKIPWEDFSGETLLIGNTLEMMLEVLIGVLVMDVKKVADEVTNIEVDKVTNMMAEFATNTSYLAVKFLTNESGVNW